MQQITRGIGRKPCIATNTAPPQTEEKQTTHRIKGFNI